MVIVVLRGVVELGARCICEPKQYINIYRLDKIYSLSIPPTPPFPVLSPPFSTRDCNEGSPVNGNTVGVAVFPYFRETELYLRLFISEAIYRIKFILFLFQFRRFRLSEYFFILKNHLRNVVNYKRIFIWQISPRRLGVLKFERNTTMFLEIYYFPRKR